MSRLKVFAMSLAVSGLVLAGPVQAGATRSAQSMPAAAGQGGLCEVKVVRSESAGVFDVAREILTNGSCRCWVKTGPSNQGGNAESLLAALQSSKSCANAPLVQAAASTGGGLGGSALWLGAAAAGVAGLVLVGTKKDSPGG